MRAWTPGRRGAAEGWRARRDDPPHTGETADLARGHGQALLRTVETEIIPRLMLLHREQSRDVAALWAADAGAVVDAAAVEHFTTELLAGQMRAIAALQAVAEQGVPPTRLCLDLLAPAARRLGDLWTEDALDFTQVTIAVGRLQALVHRVTSGMQLLRSPMAAAPSAVFAWAPGEQHRLGLSVVCDFFRAAGWAVEAEVPEQPADLLAVVRRRPIDLVGFSIGGERFVDALGALIADVRRVSMNRQVRVMVGGPLVLVRPDLVAALGADATAEDASRAILAAHAMIVEQD